MSGSIPSELSKNAFRYQVMSVLGHSAENTDMDELLEDMEDSDIWFIQGFAQGRRDADGAGLYGAVFIM